MDLSALDYAAIVANRAGREDDWLPLDDFGRVIPASSVRPVATMNPQPTFYAPLGTPVVAAVSGTVVNVPTLYSNDFSVMVGRADGTGPVWEHEHVINVRVRVGDRVVAGQQIAEVSNYECVWGRNGLATDPICASQLGLVELGLLHGGNPPSHQCPFDPAVVSPSRLSAIFDQLTSARSRIEAAFGDASKYVESTWASPQCVTLGRIEG